MPRMFAEDAVLKDAESPRAQVARLMAELDRVAAEAGHRVVGDVTVMEFESPLAGLRNVRIEADVEAAV